MGFAVTVVLRLWCGCGAADLGDEFAAEVLQ